MKPLHRNFSVQICMEMSCLHHSTPWVGTVVEGQLPKKFFFTLRIEKNANVHRKVIFPGGRVEIKYQNFFARNCMKCADMHRNII